jgi:conjugative relaxase-like TrwC/TraI family protein
MPSLVVVLSIGKLARGAEGYYLNAVAKGIEDYYLGSGEALGRWIGAGSARLGLSGVVDGAALRAVLDGRRPEDGRSVLWVRREDRLPGFDLTFSAPKGVSLLFALADPRTSLLVREAHDRAVTAALGYLEREAGEVRRGRDGVDRLPGGGFVAAGFRHRTSRAGDPQLHTHVLVANMTRGQDGRWSALDGRQLYLQAKTAGTLYQTALRHELRALGLRFTLPENGLCELADIPRRVLRGFSRRRVEIETELARRGESSRAAARVATLATRKAKDYRVPAESLAAQWHHRADALGFDAEARGRLLGQTTPAPSSREVLAQAAAVMLGPAGLTARSPVFDRRDALRAWCAQLPGGAPVEQVERLADTLLGQPDVIPVDRAGREAQRPGAQRSLARHTTTDMLATEAAVINAAVAARGTGRAVVPDDEVQQMIAARPSLSGEQAAMVRSLTTSGHGVEVVVGKAGTGKTHALVAAQEAWTAAGLRVLGAAVAARAAVTLTEEAGIPAVSVARLLATDDRARQRGSPGIFPAGGVLVVDEAGMLGTRQLARLLDLTSGVNGKLVLVGDHRQLPELAAGGTFRALARELTAVRLTQNRRQVRAWERGALDELRTGGVDAGIDAYAAAGRVSVADTVADQRAALIAAWWQATRSGDPHQVVMLSHRRADVAALNELARARLLADGHLTGPNVYGVDERDNVRPFATGDSVVVRRNDYRDGLVNGQRGVVVAADPEVGRLRVCVGNQDVSVSAEQLDDGLLDHGYALTVHQAQGLTVDRALLLGSSSLYREAGYVGLSRGRHDNQLFLTDQTDDLAYTDEVDHPRSPAAGGQPDAITAAVSTWRRSRAQHTAHDLSR